MWPDRVSNPGPLALESDALPTTLRGPAYWIVKRNHLIFMTSALIYMVTQFLEFQDICPRTPVPL